MRVFQLIIFRHISVYIFVKSRRFRRKGGKLYKPVAAVDIQHLGNRAELMSRVISQLRAK